MGQTNYSVGHEAELRAADYLKNLGYKIIELNWKTRLCEVDIIAKKQAVMYLIEVKYRSSGRQGSGFDYITPKKLEQMKFAAQCWVQDNMYRGDYELAAIEVSGSDFTITSFLPNIL